jgi:YD repeat-containing protein
VIRSSSDESSPVLKDIRYYYDASGKPIAIRVFARNNANESFPEDGDIYYLQTNLQGDVVGIYNASGTKIYEYAYDAWGNIIKSAQVATGGSAAHAVNPFRYRGYYYDTETGFYYLQLRYYNPG